MTATTTAPHGAGTPGSDALVAAAQAAAPLVPAPHPLVAAPGAGAHPAATAVAHVATFTGSRSGEVVVALDGALVEALTAGAPGLEVADVVRPALEAAAASLGPSVLSTVRPALVDDFPKGSFVALLGDGAPLAWVGLTVRAEGAPPVPRQGTVHADGGAPAAQALGGLGLNLLRDVEMTLSVEVGRARMTVRELLELTPGSVVELDRAAGAPADLLVNGRVIARGEVVVVDEDFGLRITELVEPGGPTA